MVKTQEIPKHGGRFHVHPGESKHLKYPDCAKGGMIAHWDGCRFEFTLEEITTVENVPLMSRDGMDHRPDVTTTTGHINCTICGATWDYSFTNGDRRLTDIVMVAGPTP